MGKIKLAAATAALMAAAAFTPASAAPAVSPGATQGISQAAGDNVSQVQYRRHGHRGRHGHWRGHRHRGWGNGWGWGAAGLATGLLLSSPYWAGDEGYAEPHYGGSYAYEGGGDGFARCEQTFRSFDPRSGTYMGYDGVRRRCPYI
jgi:hypothetical protein